jgi:L-lactate permease
VIKVAPMIVTPTAIPAVFKLDPISATGTAIFFSALISMLILKINIKTGLTTLKETSTATALADPVHRHGAGVRLSPTSPACPRPWPG